MTPEFRADIISYLDTFIIANGNKEITGPQVNEAIAKTVYSAFLQLDEPRFVGQDVGFVSPNGDDVEAVFGDFSQPFQTVEAAFNAAPSQNFKIVCLGGTYTELDGTVVVSVKTDFSLDLSGCVLNANILLNGCFDAKIENGGGTINGRVQLGAGGSENIELRGGTVNYSVGSLVDDVVSVGEGCVLNGVIMTTNTNLSVVSGAEATNPQKRPQITNCLLINNAVGGYGIASGVATFENCGIVSYRIASVTAVGVVRLINCVGFASGDFAFFGNPNCLLDVEGGRYESANLIIRAGGTASHLFFRNAQLDAGTAIIQYDNVNRASTTQNAFENCRLFWGNVNFINELYDGSDAGELKLFNCRVEKALGTFDPLKVKEVGTDVDTNLQKITT